MIINPSMPNGHVIFCDDVRQEINGKLTIVGAYTNEMFVYSSKPTSVRLAALVVYRHTHTGISGVTTFRAFQDIDGKQNVLFECETDIPELPAQVVNKPSEDADSVRFAEVRFVIPATEISVGEDSIIKVRAYTGNDEVRLGALRVRLSATPPTGSPPTE